MILGIGVDVAPIVRVARLVEQHASELERIFTPGERAFCDRAPGGYAMCAMPRRLPGRKPR